MTLTEREYRPDPGVSFFELTEPGYKAATVLNALLLSTLLGVAADAGAPVATPAPVAAPAAPAGEPAEFIDDVKVVFNVITCQSVPVPAPLDAKMVDWYCERQKPHLARFNEHWGTGGKEFLGTLRPAKVPDELVYPFGGGDMMMALTSFPDAKVITTMSLELAGDPRRLKVVKDTATLKQSLAGLLETSNTTLLSNDSKSVNLSKIQRGELPGQLSMHLIGLALHSMEPVSVRFFRIEPDGTLHYYSQAEIDALEGTKAKQLQERWKSPDFSPRSRTSKCNSCPWASRTPPAAFTATSPPTCRTTGSRRTPGCSNTSSRRPRLAAMTKAASYLLWNGNFSVIRDYLTSHLDFMFSDSTGVLPKFVKKAGLTMETYGSFHQSFLATAEASQEDLRHEFEVQPKRKLPMRFGYPDGSPEKRSHLIVVRRPVEGADAGQ